MYIGASPYFNRAGKNVYKFDLRILLGNDIIVRFVLSIHFYEQERISERSYYR